MLRYVDHILNFCSSLRVAVVLLLGLATVAVFGTIWPSRDAGLDAFRFELFYQSPWFRLLLLLLALNLTVCTVRLILRKKRQFEKWSTESPAEHLRGSESPLDISALEKAAGQNRYRIRKTGYGLLAWRGTFGRWGVIGIHLSLLLVMAGGMASGLGFVGTLNIYTGTSSTQFFDWGMQQDRPIGFVFRLDHFEPRYYPIELKFAVIDPRDGRQVEEIQGVVGEEVAIPSLGLTAKIDQFDPLRQRLVLRLNSREGFLREYIAEVGVKDPANTVQGHVLYPTAFRDPILKQYHSEVSILEHGEVVRQGVIQVNQPLLHRGVRIYQTAFNADDQGKLYAGFQFVRDPGESLVWSGCILFVLFLLLNMSIRFRAVALLPTPEGTRVVPLTGFAGEAGRNILDQLLTVKGRGDTG